MVKRTPVLTNKTAVEHFSTLSDNEPHVWLCRDEMNDYFELSHPTHVQVCFSDKPVKDSYKIERVDEDTYRDEEGNYISFDISVVGWLLNRFQVEPDQLWVWVEIVG